MKYFVFLLFLSFCLSFHSQTTTDQQLASLYYSQGEYAKAIPYYEKFINKKSSKFDVLRLLECYEAEKNIKEAEKLLKRQVKELPEEKDYLILLGDFYERNEQVKEANKIYENLIDEAKDYGYKSVELYNAFVNRGKLELALKTLEAARKKHKKNYPLNLQFAEVYGMLSRTDDMIDEYFDLLDIQPNTLNDIQNKLSMQIDFQEDQTGVYGKLKEKLLLRIQKSPDDVVYSKMLIWLFIQKKEFKSALMQAAALDKRTGETGDKLMEIAETFVQNSAYDLARSAYKTVIGYGQKNMNFYAAYSALLNVRYREITVEKKFDANLISETKDDYRAAIKSVGWNRNALNMSKELSVILAYYDNNPKAAIYLLDSCLSLPGLTQLELAQIKMTLADIFVLDDDIWDASIFYMQITKDFKFEDIGSEAKFKNARVFYYDGDFAFAQSQLDVLKQATDKLIANDAMKLSILITDNLGLDSNFQAMEQFAKADLLLEQHQYEKAFFIYDSIAAENPASGLLDEILFRKAQAMQQQGKWTDACTYLEKIIVYHMNDILSDDAIFQLGDIYENHLNDKEKAAEYYKKILFECKGSLLTVEARKRFRNIRGDKFNEEEFD